MNYNKSYNGGNLHGTFAQVSRTSSSSSATSNPGRRRGYSGVRSPQNTSTTNPQVIPGTFSTPATLTRSSPTVTRRPFNQKSAIMETTFGPSYSAVTTITTDGGNQTKYHHQRDRTLSTSSHSQSIDSTNDRNSMYPDHGAVGGSHSQVPTLQYQEISERPRQGSNLSNTSTLSQNSFQNEVPLLFTEMPNSQLFCKVCNHVYNNPTITTCGHSFCKSCLNAVQHCPTDGKPIQAVIHNLALEEQIGSLTIHCRYGTKPIPDNPGEYDVDMNGCNYTVKLMERRLHEDECDFAPVHCPNNPDCPLMLKKHLQDHLLTCNHIKCRNHSYGRTIDRGQDNKTEGRFKTRHTIVYKQCCTFVGDQEQYTSHLTECKYELVKDFLHLIEDRITELTVTVRQRDEENNFLRTMLSKTADRVDQLEKSMDDKIDLLSQNQSKLNEEMHDFRQSSVVITNELQDLNTRLSMGGVGLFDPQQIFKCKGTFVGHTGPVWCLCVHGDLLFSGSSDKNIKVWDTATNYKCQKTLEGHANIVLALTTHGSKLFSGSSDCTIKVWDIGKLEEVASIDGHDNGICTMVCSNNLLFSGSLKIIKVWKIEGSQLIHKQDLTGLNHWVRALFASQNRIYSGSYQTVKIWDIHSLELLHVLDTSGGSVYSITVTNHHIVCGTYENRIHVWDINSHAQVATLTGHVGTVYALACLSTPDQTKVFSASYDRSIRVWSLDNMLCTQTLIRHQGSVTSLAISRGRLFSGAVDATVKVWQ